MGTPVQTAACAYHRKRLKLRVTPESVPAGRHWFRATVATIEGGLDPDKAADMELILSELLTNVVRHTQSKRCWVLVAWSESRIIFGVSDEFPHKEPKIVRHDKDDLGGRGLDLVSALAEHWGYSICCEGRLKIVWAQFGRDPEHAAVSRAVPSQLRR